MSDDLVAEWQGWCPICRSATTFRATSSWFRDYLLCPSCPGGSIPRERAVMLTLETERPNWRDLIIHESSPSERGASLILKRHCAGYVPSQLFRDVRHGMYGDGCRCEDIEQQTFADETFDVVITQDVMEHVFEPMLAYREIWRTLRPGGIHIHTTPMHKNILRSERRAERGLDGSIIHLAPAEYHGNPIDDGGSLVTFLWGHDLPDLIAEWTPFDVELRRFNDRTHGIVAEHSEVIICRKRSSMTTVKGGLGIRERGSV